MTSEDIKHQLIIINNRPVERSHNYKGSRWHATDLWEHLTTQMAVPIQLAGGPHRHSWPLEPFHWQKTLSMLFLLHSSNQALTVCTVHLPQVRILQPFYFWHLQQVKSHAVHLSLQKPCSTLIVQKLCESWGGHPGLSVLTSLLVSVDVKIYCTVLRHWSQLVPNMSTDIWGH